MKLRSIPVMSAGVLVAALTVVAAPSASLAYGTGPSCGGTVYKADGTPWQCTFDDEFSASRLDSTKWIAQTNMATGDPSVAYACFENGLSNVSVSGGSLHLSVRKQSTPVTCGQSFPTNYTAGQVSSYHLFSQQYGRVEARMRTTATVAPGLHEAFWLWPDDRYTSINWPTTGEIDVAETYSNYSTLAVPYLHYTANDNGGPIPGTNTAFCGALRGVWNTYDLVWTPTSITISVNGQTCLVNTSSDPAFNQRYILALSGTLGFGGDALTPLTPIPETTDVDYVRAWQ